MIREIKIENFKSIEQVSLDFGRITIFIGENGSGKSNILEALAMSSAAANNKLDNEFLTSRGIRVTEPKMMRSAFDPKSAEKPIRLSVEGQNSIGFNCVLQHDNRPYSKWINMESVSFYIIEEKSKPSGERIVMSSKEEYVKLFKEDFVKSLKEDLEKDMDGPKLFSKDFIKLSKEELLKSDEIVEKVADKFFPTFFKELLAFNATPHLHKFLIYAPESPSLRTFERDGQILPLGTKGEGLFKLLINLNFNEDKEKLADIKARLRSVEWLEDFEIPHNIHKTEGYIRIRDKYLPGGVTYADPQSADQGFWLLLFYFCLFVSDDTPKFFAIDNIDSGLSPETCVAAIRSMAQLAEKYDKQAIFTAHNPAVLNGLGQADADWKFYRVARGESGRTEVALL